MFYFVQNISTCDTELCYIYDNFIHVIPYQYQLALLIATYPIDI